jgi:hypothetical protein
VACRWSNSTSSISFSTSQSGCTRSTRRSGEVADGTGHYR